MSKNPASNNYIFLGVGLSLVSSLGYSLLYLLSFYLQNISDIYILVFRVIFTSIPIMFFVYLMIRWIRIKRYLLRLKRETKLIVITVINSAMVCYQTWLFSWAPANGHGLDISMGYLILPIGIIMVGKLLFKEQMNGFKKLATLFVILGVVINLIITQHFSVYTFIIAFNYTLLFAIRRSFAMDGLAAVFVESLCLLVITIGVASYAYYFIPGFAEFSFFKSSGFLQLILIAVGLLSAISWISYILSGKYLSFNLWGLLSFVEVIFLFLISLLIGESIDYNELPMYSLLGIGMLILIAENLYNLLKSK